MTNHTDKLLEMIKFLREDADGCPWTKEQTHQSLAQHIIEESYEVADSIAQGEVADELQDELGDMLLQLALHTQIANEDGRFTFDDIAKSIVDKLIRRYPTIFGDDDETLTTPEQIDKRWEEVKAAEREKKGYTSILDGITKASPALVRAQKLKGRAGREGWEWPSLESLWDKVYEEIDEIKEELNTESAKKEDIASEIGDLLFMVCDLARWHDIDAEEALRLTCDRFEGRFRHMESRLQSIGQPIGQHKHEDQLRFWNEAKQLEKEKKKGAA